MKSQFGFTLTELLVGTAAALLILLVVADLEIRAWRFSRLDQQNMVSKAEASVAVDRFALDTRQASGFSLAQPGAPAVTLTLPAGAVTYRYDPVTRDVVRDQAGTSRILTRNAAGLAFHAEAGGKLLRMDLTVTLTGGGVYRLQTRSAPRLVP